MDQIDPSALATLMLFGAMALCFLVMLTDFFSYRMNRMWIVRQKPSARTVALRYAALGRAIMGLAQLVIFAALVTELSSVVMETVPN